MDVIYSITTNNAGTIFLVDGLDRVLDETSDVENDDELATWVAEVIKRQPTLIN